MLFFYAKNFVGNIYILYVIIYAYNFTQKKKHILLFANPTVRFKKQICLFLFLEAVSAGFLFVCNARLLSTFSLSNAPNTFGFIVS